MSTGVVVMKSAPAWHASLMERMELEGIVGQANHAGKREILVEEEDSAAEIGPGRIIFTEERYRLWSKRDKMLASGTTPRIEIRNT